MLRRSDAAVAQIDQRLEVKLELLRCESFAQVQFERAPLLRRYFHLQREKTMVAAAAIFSRIERHVGLLQELVGVDPVHGGHGGADRSADVERILECSRKALGEQALVAYGESCVRILHRNINCLGLPMVTIGLAQGDALGGGFESLLSFNVIIAERGAKFGWPRKIGCKPWRSRLSRLS